MFAQGGGGEVVVADRCSTEPPRAWYLIQNVTFFIPLVEKLKNSTSAFIILTWRLQEGENVQKTPVSQSHFFMFRGIHMCIYKAHTCVCVRV